MTSPPERRLAMASRCISRVAAGRGPCLDHRRSHRATADRDPSRSRSLGTMSRQKGSRQRPVADRTRYREQFSRRSQRPTAAPAVIIGEPISRRRRWAAALGATFVLLIAFTAVITAIVQQDRDNAGGASIAVAVAAALVPVAFTVLARVSRSGRPVRSVFIVAPLGDRGVSRGGIAGTRPDFVLGARLRHRRGIRARADPVHRIPMRITAVGVLSAVTLLLAVVAPVAAVVVAPFLPFTALVVADIVAEARSVV